MMDFSDALLYLKAGKRLTRHGWNAPQQWVELQVPDEHSKMRRPYLYLCPVGGALVPWTPTQSDMLSEDWVIA